MRHFLIQFVNLVITNKFSVHFWKKNAQKLVKNTDTQHLNTKVSIITEA